MVIGRSWSAWRPTLREMGSRLSAEARSDVEGEPWRGYLDRPGEGRRGCGGGLLRVAPGWDVGDHQSADTGLLGVLSRLRAGQVDHARVVRTVAERGLTQQRVCPGGKVDERRTRRGVPGVDE